MASRLTRRFVLSVLLTLSATLASHAQQADDGTSDPLQLFEQRIMPIFKSPEPSSCVQCHLASVDLKDYILPSAEKTFASLRDQGLIDLDRPGDSKILELIQMGERDGDERARLIHEATRRAEYEAFAHWIRACCEDPVMRSLPASNNSQRARPAQDDTIIRHTRKSRVLDSFVRNVWSQRMRCFPCHTPYELDESNPRHKVAIQKQKEFAQQYGEELATRIKFFQKTPAETMRHLIARSRAAGEGEIPIINLKDPRRSLLVMKPLSKIPPKDEDGQLQVPAAAEPMFHMGGLKMHPHDQTYKSFIAWIQDYAHVVEGRYTSIDDLPTDNWYPTKRVLRLTHAPETWSVGTPVQLFVYPAADEGDDLPPQPIAFTQGTVTPRGMVNGALFLLGHATSHPPEASSAEPAELAAGDYRVRVYVDTQGKLTDEPTLLLDEDDFVGEVALDGARWREGFPRAERISARDLVR